MLGILGDDGGKQGAGFGGFVLAQEALAKMGAGVEVLRIAFQCGAVAGLGALEFALVKVNVAKLGVVVRFIQVMDLGLELFDAAAVAGPGQLEAARRRGGGAIDVEVVPESPESPAKKNEERPDPFPLPNRVHQHPKLEGGNQQRHG